MNLLAEKYKRYKEIQRHHAGETLTLRGEDGTTRRLYLSDWVVLSRLELRRQEKHPDHSIHWMSLEEILKACEPYDIVSFDVFDTLLCRDCGASGNLFVILEKQNGIPDFAEARQAAERRAREGKGEIVLREIYEQLEKDGIVADGSAAMEQEWELEKKLIAPHPLMLSLVRKLLERKQRFIAVSDMYLSSKQIAELLEIAGYPLPEHIFVSCEESVGKAGGAIYQRVKEKIHAARVLHIGDNEDADGFCAARAGWDTAMLRNPALLPWEYFAVTPYGGDMITSSLCRRRRYDGVNDLHSEVYNIGYTVTGPLTVGFCQWIHQMRAERHWEKLFFSARDGWIMHKIYTRYFGEAEYLPVSRAAVQMLDLECQAPSYCDNNLPAHLCTGETVGQVLRGMMLDPLLPSWQSEGLQPEAPFNEETKAQAEKLILRDRKKIAEAFAPARENARLWFAERLAGVRKAVVIDTGWKGSAGATLRDFVKENGMETVLDTALMGTSRSASVAVREERGELYSWLFSPSHDRDRLGKQYEGGKSLACTLFEMLFMTTLPQLLSYAGEGFTYGQADERNRAMVEDLQAGALDFARDYDHVIRKIETDMPGKSGHKSFKAGEENKEGIRPDQREVLFPIPAATTWRYFEELILEKERLRRVFGSYVHYLAPTQEGGEITFEDRMRMNGWIRTHKKV